MTLELVVEMKLEWILVYLLMKMALEILINFAQKLTAMSYNFDCLKCFLRRNCTLFEVLFVLDQNDQNHILHLSHLERHRQKDPFFFVEVIM